MFGLSSIAIQLIWYVVVAVVASGGGWYFSGLRCDNARMKLELKAAADVKAAEERGNKRAQEAIADREILRSKIEDEKSKLTLALGRSNLSKSCRIDDGLRDAINKHLEGSTRITGNVPPQSRAPG